jgi:hypothetical protein
MKSIKILMTDEAYNAVRRAFSARAMAGNTYGTLDAFVRKFVEAVEGERPHVAYRTKGEEEPTE